MLLKAVGEERRGMPDRQRDETLDALGGHQRGSPRYAGPPVVTDDVGSLGAGGGDHAQHVTDKQIHRVGGDLSRLVRAAVATHVGDDHLEPRLGQRRYLMAP